MLKAASRVNSVQQPFRSVLVQPIVWSEALRRCRSQSREPRRVFVMGLRVFSRLQQPKTQGEIRSVP